MGKELAPEIQAHTEQKTGTDVSERPKSTWFDRIHDCAETCASIGYSLGDLSSALYRAGQRDLANELAEYAAALCKTGPEIGHCVGESLAERLHETEQSTANMLMSALGVLTKDPATPSIDGGSE